MSQFSFSPARGAKPIERQENPAAWVLRAYAGEHVSNNADWAELYKLSDQFNMFRKQIESIRESANALKKLTFASTYSTSMREQVRFMCARMLTIYRRSAPYNMTRIVVAILYAFLLGSMYFGSPSWEDRHVNNTEGQAAALIGTVFLSLNVVGTTGE